MAVTTRPATRIDLPTLLTFEQGIITAERPFDPTLRPDPISYYDVGSFIDSPEALVIVAESDGALIGSGCARKKESLHFTEPAFHAHLGFMYVVPEYRGQGVNQLILQDLLAWARERELLEIRLTVYPENQSAIRAYEKVGMHNHLLEMRMNLKED
ncbi:MAG: GNAT family N-acetyltransferase [Planctomycetota bacterium]